MNLERALCMTHAAREIAPDAESYAKDRREGRYRLLYLPIN